MAKIDWKSLTFTGKEVLGAISLVVTLSGIWYKITYEIKEQAATIELLNSKGDGRQREINELKAQIKVLENDKLRRDAIIEYSGGYFPLQKVKKR